MTWYFLCDGDPQFGMENSDPGATYPMARPTSRNIVQRINKINITYPINFVICAGDLTSHGWGASGCCKKNPDEFGEFINQYAIPIENAGFPLFSCPGNHDTYVDWPYFDKPVFEYIKTKYVATHDMFKDWKYSGCYSFNHNGVEFISMGVYPYNLAWLREYIPTDDTPIIIFYHYNTVTGEPYSDWWGEDEKTAFYDVIKDNNVLLIINGHWHESGIGHWNGIPVVRGAGDKFCIVEIKDRVLGNIKFKSGY